MTNQNYKNHTRFYPLHHFIITPLTLLLLTWTVVKSDFSTSQMTSDSIYRLLSAFLIVSLPQLSRLYAMKNQDRIIRMELRHRYYQLTGHPFYEKENQLHGKQLIALRFAGDDEFLTIIDSAIERKMDAKEIKKSIKSWKADNHRV